MKLHDLPGDRVNPRRSTAPLVTAALLLGWAYSVPPFRLKTRPGWDVAVNALVVGVVSPAAGWSITRAPWQFPWPPGPGGCAVCSAYL